MPNQIQTLQQAATEARGLAMDAISACKSGHLGLPLGCAEIGAALWGMALSYVPTRPDWINRDRFVLSAGHGSMFIYSWLHLAGYDLSRDDLRKFRQLHSKTPGHPESFMTEGVEATTGPLGQGTGNLVGMAAAAKAAAAIFNTDEHTIFNHHVIGLAGDGCLQEGISYEAAAFAGRFGLDNLILLYDANDITLDAMADKTQNEDTAARFTAANWDVVQLNDAHDILEIAGAVKEAKANDNGKPTLIICKTEVGRGIDEIAGSFKAHGEAGVKFVDDARRKLGLPAETFFVSGETLSFFENRRAELEADHSAWEQTYNAWRAANPDKAELLDRGVAKDWGTVESLLDVIPPADPGTHVATRAAGATALNAIAKVCPLLNSGSADLHGSTKNYIADAGDFDVGNYGGRNFYFGIREHAMGAIVNGFGYYGLFKASGATFLTFADYSRPAVRLAALSGLPVFHIWTHDSVGVGEDGPTHQPVELVAALRAMPNLRVIRPADFEETAAAFALAIAEKTHPFGIVLSRQGLPNLDEISVETRRQGTIRGGYIACRETAPLECILLASGSELEHAVVAAKQLGAGCRVVSMPCFELFEAQPKSYQEEVLPASCRKRVAIEAGVTLPWGRYVGLDGKVIGTDTFGISAPGDTVLAEFGISAENVVETMKSL